MFVKICGITRIEDAELALAAGADAIGVNLVKKSPRHVDAETARRIALAMRDRMLVVGVVADLPLSELLSLRSSLGLGALQLHGAEPPELLASLLPDAYKAVRVASPEDVAAADRYGGDRLLLDAHVQGALGGTGRTFEWAWAAELAGRRRVIVAGGLGPDNVARAVQTLRPWGVDVASGVERAGAPREKDPEKLLAFVRAARVSTSSAGRE